MMNARKAMLFLAVFFLLLAFTLPAVSQQGDSIIVNNADEVKEKSVSADQNLLDSFAGVRQRVVVQYANRLLSPELVAVPGSLQTLLGQVPARVVVQFANNGRRRSLVTVPGTLQTLLNQVSDRVIFQYANANRGSQLVYPAALINDTTLPLLTDIAARTTGIGIADITWTTDEFATSTVLYGTQPGDYPQAVNDPLYYKEHVVTLSNLTSGTTYYYKVSSTDRSGNTITSEEYSFIALIHIYLPLVVR